MKRPKHQGISVTLSSHLLSSRNIPAGSNSAGIWALFKNSCIISMPRWCLAWQLRLPRQTNASTVAQHQQVREKRIGAPSLKLKAILSCSSDICKPRHLGGLALSHSLAPSQAAPCSQAALLSLAYWRN